MYWHAMTNADDCVRAGFFMHIIVGPAPGNADEITSKGVKPRDFVLEYAGLGEEMRTTVKYTKTFDHEPTEAEKKSMEPDGFESIEDTYADEDEDADGDWDDDGIEL